MSGGKSTVTVPLVVRAAVLLAARLFPNHAPVEEADWRHVARLEDAHFLLSGHLPLWDRWADLPEEDRLRIARLLRHRPASLAYRTVFFQEVELLLQNGEVSEFAVGNAEHRVVVMPAVDTGARIDGLLRQLDEHQVKASRARLVKPAGPGRYFSEIRVPDPLSASRRAVGVHFDLQVPAASPVVHPQLGESAELEDLHVPFADLEKIAAALDGAYGERHRAKAVVDLRKYLRHGDGAPVGKVLAVTAGPTSLLHAPTGLGKNIAAELIAAWCVCRGLTVALVVPQSAQVVQAVFRLRRDLTALAGLGGEGWEGLDTSGCAEATVLPLISTRSMQKLAEETAASPQDSAEHREQVYREMSYSCALSAHAVVDQGNVGAWEPGQEPCDQLKGSDGKTYSCPWRGSCGKFRHHRAAVSGDVIVTNHASFLVGRIHIPLTDHGAHRRDVTVEELLVRRAHVVMMDEVDALQATAFEQAAKEVLLARYGSVSTPVRDLEAQFSQHCARLDRNVEEYLHPKIKHLSWLAEAYVSHLARGAITPGQDRRRMVVPRRWDAMVAHRIFDLTGEERPSEQQMRAVAQLFTRDGPLELSEKVSGLEELRAVLSRITDLSDGTDNFSAATLDRLGEAFRQVITASRTGHAGTDRGLVEEDGSGAEGDGKSAVVRDEEIGDLVQYSARRAYLEKIREILRQIVGVAAPLQGAGMTASNKLAEVLSSHVPWRAAPYGPLGRPLFAFSEHFNDQDLTDTSLTLKSFVGDPHSHMAHLGDVTALAHGGRRRVVIGMSATAHMPHAPRHHLLVAPTWYVPDDVNGSLTAQLDKLQAEGSWVRISGATGQRREDGYIAMGSALWRKLDGELKAVAAQESTAHRAHALVSYEAYHGGPLLAQGMIAAGASPGEICVAVPSRDMARYTARPPGWVPVPSDRLEQFPLHIGHGQCRFLLAPMARVERGLNIVDHRGRSLLNVACLAVRPVLVMEDPPVLLAMVNSLAYRDAPAPGPDPADALERLRVGAGRTFEDIRRGSQYFKHLGLQVKLAIVAEVLTRLIQLGGRTRRGGDHGTLHLADAAFTETTADSTLPHLLGELRAEWERRGELALVERIYRSTFDILFSLTADDTPLEVPV